jgi:hypothetical protein
MKRFAHTTIVIALLVVHAACSSMVPRAVGERIGTHPTLRGGAQSIDELVQDLVVAMHASDEGALRSLRVSEAEYREIILPGSVPPGGTPPQYAPEFTDFLWGSLDVRNRYGEQELLRLWGGKSLTVESASFHRGVRAYRGYTAHSLLDLTVKDDEGKEVRMEMGSIAQVGDRFKFISFTRD